MDTLLTAKVVVTAPRTWSNVLLGVPERILDQHTDTATVGLLAAQIERALALGGVGVFPAIDFSCHLA